VRQDWVIERIGDGGHYMTLWGWANIEREALRFESSDDAEGYIRKNRIRNAQAVTVTPVDVQAAPSVKSDYNPFGAPT